MNIHYPLPSAFRCKMDSAHAYEKSSLFEQLMLNKAEQICASAVLFWSVSFGSSVKAA